MSEQSLGGPRQEDSDGLAAWTGRIHTVDAFDLLDDLPENSVHALVGDPPYGLKFLGLEWDNFETDRADAPDGIAYHKWCRTWLEKAYRVLRPGGHLVLFSGNTTYHWLATAVELAGFDYRRLNVWLYGNGFPKGRNPAFDIDWPQEDPTMYRFHDGWETEQKPALEPICLARKPISEDSVAENVQTWGTGVLNIDECRIETDDDLSGGGATDYYEGGDFTEANDGQTNGRFPGDVLLDEAAADALDDSAGPTEDGHWNDSRGESGYRGGLDGQDNLEERYDAHGGGPSRYYYTSKASKSERTLDGRIENGHETVKPLDLMEWLVTLVTAEGQIVLDMFAGTGTTCLAAKNTGRQFIGGEKRNTAEEPWADVARIRCGLTPEHPEWLRSDDNQVGFEAFTTDGGETADKTSTDTDRDGGDEA
jgi:site-specific DNA-methyltransferase (adenine-specific)